MPIVENICCLVDRDGRSQLPKVSIFLNIYSSWIYIKTFLLLSPSSINLYQSGWNFAWTFAMKMYIYLKKIISVVCLFMHRVGTICVSFSLFFKKSNKIGLNFYVLSPLLWYLQLAKQDSVCGFDNLAWIMHNICVFFHFYY